MWLVCTRIASVCHSHVIRMSLVYHSYVIRMSLVCTRMSSVCHSYVLYVIRMSLACTRMSFVCHSYVLVCHPYDTRMCFYHEPQWGSFITDTIFKTMHEIKTSIKFRPVWYICPHWYMCHEIRNEQILSLFTPTFGETWKKTSNHNILFLRLAFFEKVKSVYEISKIAILTVFRIGFFGAAEGWGGRGGGGGESDNTRLLLQKNLSHTSYSDETWHTPWVLLPSAFFQRKSLVFVISRNTDIDCILIHSF